MKKYPYPDEKLKKIDDVRKYINKLVNNIKGYLQIDGWVGWTLFPKDTGFIAENSEMNINITYPYKKYKLSIEQEHIDNCLKEKSDSPYWNNLERDIFHELTHILIDPLESIARKRFTNSDEIRDANEHLTDHFSIAFYNLVEDFRKERDRADCAEKKLKKQNKLDKNLNKKKKK